MAIAIALVLVVVGSIVFHYWSPWWFTPLASNWEQMDNTLVMTLWISGVVFVAVNFFVAYSVVRFRYKKGRRSHYDPENSKLEWWLMGVTSVGVVAMLAPGLLVYGKFVNPPEDAAVVEVVGQQWRWSYRFPGEDGILGRADNRLISSDNPFGMLPGNSFGQDDILVQSDDLHLPIDKPVKILLRSKDVLHDFYVPNFRVKMDSIPGQVTSFWFTPTKAGEYDVACAEYCGIGHYVMKSSVVVEDQDVFHSWLNSQPTFEEAMAKAAGKSVNPLVEKGEEIAIEHGCLGCHSIDGSPSVGPTFKGLFGKTEALTDGGSVEVDEAFLKESILDPNAAIVEGFAPTMPAYELGDEDLDALVAFVISQSSDNAGAQTGDELSEQGRLLSENNGCLGCHSIDGSPGVGPTWKGLFGKTETLADGNQVEVDEDFLIESIVDPNATLIEGYAAGMPPYTFSQEELDAIVAYTKQISQ